MAKRYTDETGRVRCGTCDGYVVADKKCKKCRNKKLKLKAEDRAAREATEREAERKREATRRAEWRHLVLRRYVNRILSLNGAARLAALEANNISSHDLQRILGW
jgi:hypothetical protein